jgi:hypothetical protein
VAGEVVEPVGELTDGDDDPDSTGELADDDGLDEELD